ncbi:MAG: hypothetical protein ABIR54_22360 [Burkholderiaceae bacterium]
MLTPTRPDSGTVRSRYVRAINGVTLVLNYTEREAKPLREAINGIRLRGDRKPSLSLLARRSMALYLELLHRDPEARAQEMEALELLATPLATRRKTVPE